MDNVIRPRLLDARFGKIEAEIGPAAAFDKGGKLKVSVSAGIVPNETNNQALGHVKVVVLGIPGDAKTEKNFAFRVELVCNGIFEWPESTLRPDNLHEMPIALELCNQLNVLVVAEIGHITQRLGFPNVRIPWDLPPPTGRKPARSRSHSPNIRKSKGVAKK